VVIKRKNKMSLFQDIAMKVERTRVLETVLHLRQMSSPPRSIIVMIIMDHLHVTAGSPR